MNGFLNDARVIKLFTRNSSTAIITFPYQKTCGLGMLPLAYEHVVKLTDCPVGTMFVAALYKIAR